MGNNKKNKHFHNISEGGDKQFDHVPVQAKPLEVKVYDNFDRALRAFRALVQKERVVSNYKEKQSYEKPSDKKRRKREEKRRKDLDIARKNEHNKQRKTSK